MKIVYGKTLGGKERAAAQVAAENCGITYDTARLLFCRGTDTEDKIKKFINPDKSGIYNPFLLGGISAAADRLREAREKGENVLIFGDYDADGICAASIMFFCLADYGLNAKVAIPERDDGYGLNLQIVEKLHNEKKIDVLITVDCGISDADKIEVLKSYGIDVIVTDHHEPPEILPDAITVNPKIKGQEYPFDGLCGAGVAYKLGQALIGDGADVCLDLAALATVADSMELVDENRCIVAEGLKIINSPRARRPFRYLLGDNSAKKVTAQTLAFQIAPRINAGGRMGDAATALKAFISDSDNEVFDCCVKLGKYNVARQSECDEIYRSAKQKIREENLSEDEVILVADKDWKTGFIGIVAARLVEDYARPVIVFAGVDGGLKGSARSVPAINIYDALVAASGLLSGFGGHSQAAGVSVSTENFGALRRALCEYVKNLGVETVCEKTIFADWKCEDKISLRFARETGMLEPFGQGNRRPLFTAETEHEIKALPIKAGSVHYSFSLPEAEMLDFAGEADSEVLALPVKKTVVFDIGYSVFNGKESFKGIVRNVIPDYGDFKSVKPFIVRNELLKILSGERPPKVRLQGEKVVFKQGFGTVYAVSEPENIKYIENHEKAEIYMFTVPPRVCSDCILVSPKEISGEYSRVIYIDLPLRTVSAAAQQVFYGGLSGKSFLENLSVGREDFAAVFSYMLNIDGREFYDSARAFCAYAPDFTAEQFVFSAEVFLELGIFRIKDGRLRFDPLVKSSLDNSAIYRAVREELQ